MNKNQQITNLENKITEIKSILKNWVKDIENYNFTLTELTNQLNIIKTKSINKNTKQNMNNQINKKVSETLNNIK